MSCGPGMKGMHGCHFASRVALVGSKDDVGLQTAVAQRHHSKRAHPRATAQSRFSTLCPTRVLDRTISCCKARRTFSGSHLRKASLSTSGHFAREVMLCVASTSPGHGNCFSPSGVAIVQGQSNKLAVWGILISPSEREVKGNNSLCTVSGIGGLARITPALILHANRAPRLKWKMC